MQDLRCSRAKEANRDYLLIKNLPNRNIDAPKQLTLASPVDNRFTVADLC
jgi:hypothetical protein